MNEQDSEINSQHSSKSNKIFGGASGNNVNNNATAYENADSNSPMMVDDDEEMNNEEPEVELMDDEDDDDDDEDDLEEDEDEDAKLDDDFLNNNKKLLNKNLEFGVTAESQQVPGGGGIESAALTGGVGGVDENAASQPLLSHEEYERRRFQSELEFVQSLANPDYLNFLAQRGFFRNQSLINYLKYLMYWKEPDYVKYITYPQCLSLLEMLQHETFLKEIVKGECSKYIDEQLVMLWFHYKNARDWCKTDPTKLPDNLDHLFKMPPAATVKPPAAGQDDQVATTDTTTVADLPAPKTEAQAPDASSPAPLSPDAFKSQFSAIDDLFSAQSRISLAKY